MKKTLLILLLICAAFVAFAQNPASFKYQGVARDANQQAYANTALGIQLSVVLDNGSGTGAGVVQYVERHLTFTSPVGIFSLQIGEGETEFGDWADLDWGSGAYWLKVEMDVEGGDDYVYMGNSPILPVPLALHARTVDDKDDADADPENEIQTISFNPETNQLSISAGNTIAIPAGNADADPNPTNELQDLALNGLTLSISDGNQVNLAAVQDGTEDADADPQDELQDLQLNGLNLSISNGNQINLAGVQDGTEDADADPSNELQTISFDPNTNSLSLSNGGQVNLSGIGGSSLWTATPGHVKTLDNVIIGLNQNQNVLSTLEVKDDITIRRSTGAAYIDLFGATNGGNVLLYRANGTGGSNDLLVNLTTTSGGGRLDLRADDGIRSVLEVNGSGGADFSMAYPDGEEAVSINTSNISSRFRMTQPDGDDCILLGSSDFGGIATLYGSDGSVVADIGRDASNTNAGKVRIYDGGGNNAIDMQGEDGGQILVSSPITDNVYIGTVSGTTTLGKVAVYDAFNGESAGMMTDGLARGILFADIKNFRMDHPQQEDKEIWYASVEGPEAAAYERGTAQLVEGEAVIEFPDHFGLVANHETMTVMLTPLSADCKGLAVVEKTATGFRVKELFQGTGTYRFDWEVKCVRKGYEDYQVIRDKKERL